MSAAQLYSLSWDYSELPRHNLRVPYKPLEVSGVHCHIQVWAPAPTNQFYLWIISSSAHGASDSHHFDSSIEFQTFSLILKNINNKSMQVWCLDLLQQCRQQRSKFPSEPIPLYLLAPRPSGATCSFFILVSTFSLLFSLSSPSRLASWLAPRSSQFFLDYAESSSTL